MVNQTNLQQIEQLYNKSATFHKILQLVAQQIHNWSNKWNSAYIVWDWSSYWAYTDWRPTKRGLGPFIWVVQAVARLRHPCTCVRLKSS